MHFIQGNIEKLVHIRNNQCLMSKNEDTYFGIDSKI